MTTTIDYNAIARSLRIVDVWAPGNETGWVTPAVLYDPSLGYAPHLGTVEYWMLHGTAGVNTLAYWGNGGTVAPGNWTIAHYLVPHNTTFYRDNRAHDTTNTVFKMVPHAMGANHAGDCAGGVSNNNSIGVEHENKQDGSESVTDGALIKSALLYANGAAAQGIPDYKLVLHGIVAVPWGRRHDPWGGGHDLNIARWWEHVQAIRREPGVWDFWHMPQPTA